MGSALLNGVIEAGMIKPESVFLMEIDPQKRDLLRERLGINLCGTVGELARECKTMVLAVKPQVLPAVLGEVETEITTEHLLISLAAGMSLSALEELIPQGRFVRVMPNTPARIRRGVTAYAVGKNVTTNEVEQVEAIFGCVGRVLSIPEHLMDAVTAISGSGPAYVYYMIEALIDSGVLLGLGREQAQTLALETFIGAAEMLKQTEEHPAKLRAEVTSPGGTTAAGILELEKAGVSGIVMTAAQAAARRSAELAQKI